jgi:hypothetical protein
MRAGCAERDPAIEGAVAWAQTGALGDSLSSTAHGAAFPETAALRNRAFRWVAAMLAKCAREVGPERP